MVALEGAGIPTIGIFPAYYGEQPPPDADLFRLRAMFDASTPEEAVARVRDNLPPDGNYTVGHAQRIGPTWVLEMRIRATPDPIGSLTAWLNQIGTADASQSDEPGVYNVRVETDIAQMEDAEACIAQWDLDHPGQILRPE
jgi:hypothetical protein